MQGVDDNKASVPSLVRWFIVRVWRPSVMDALDWAGRRHDRRLRHGMCRAVANRKMAADMARKAEIPALIVIIIWALLAFYAALPQQLRSLYWKLA